METALGPIVLHLAKARLLKDYPGQIDVCLDALDDDQLWWRPNDRSNAVANLVLHLAGSNRYYLEHVIAGEPNTRDRAAEFATRGGLAKHDLRRRWEAGVSLAGRVLDALDPDRLVETTDRSGKTSSIAQILLHVTHHNAVHLGQIVCITKQLNPDAIDELWMKMRGR